jgi:hypothetical protein
MEWWSTLPREIGEGIWAVLPRALSDTRFAPNVTLKGSGFDADGGGLLDTTVTALVCLPGDTDAIGIACPGPAFGLRSSLPDGASGVFDPGWDVTTDTLPLDRGSPAGARATPGAPFLAAYGLGAPFVEDAKICAALGTYWPAVSPDSTRTYQPDRYWPTISPLTDEEIGIVGDMPWDGIRGPLRVADDPALVEYMDIDYADYVDQALSRQLTAVLTSRIDAAEYTRRVLAMALVYRALGVRMPAPQTVHGKERSFARRLQIFLFEKAEWNVLGFRALGPGESDSGLQEAVEQTGVTAAGPHVYACDVFKHGQDRPSPSSFKKRHVEIAEEARCYTDLAYVYVARGGGSWKAVASPTS